MASLMCFGLHVPRYEDRTTHCLGWKPVSHQPPVQSWRAVRVLASQEFISVLCAGGRSFLLLWGSGQPGLPAPAK